MYKTSRGPTPASQYNHLIRGSSTALSEKPCRRRPGRAGSCGIRSLATAVAPSAPRCCSRCAPAWPAGARRTARRWTRAARRPRARTPRRARRTTRRRGSPAAAPGPSGRPACVNDVSAALWRVERGGGGASAAFQACPDSRSCVLRVVQGGCSFGSSNIGMTFSTQRRTFVGANVLTATAEHAVMRAASLIVDLTVSVLRPC